MVLYKVNRILKEFQINSFFKKGSEGVLSVELHQNPFKTFPNRLNNFKTMKNIGFPFVRKLQSDVLQEAPGGPAEARVHPYRFAPFPSELLLWRLQPSVGFSYTFICFPSLKYS